MPIPAPAPSHLPAAAPLESEIEIPLDELDEIAGDIVSGLAILVAQGLGEFKRDAQMGADTRQQGGMLVAGLLQLRTAFVDVLDFDRLCYQAGTRALQERIGNSVSDKTIHRLTTEAVNIMVRIAKLQSN